MIQLLMIFILRVDVVCFVGRPRKAGPPPERKMEGSIDVIGGEGSRGTCTPICLLNIFFSSFINLLGHCFPSRVGGGGGNRNTPSRFKLQKLG